tara:strand:- start:383 stop:637 length:255 start_codon:yes stop_codon:yes gene_type:complete
MQPQPFGQRRTQGPMNIPQLPFQGLGSPQFSVGGGYGQAPMMNPMTQQGFFGQRRAQGPNTFQPLMRNAGRRFYGGGITDLYPR